MKIHSRIPAVGFIAMVLAMVLVLASGSGAFAAANPKPQAPRDSTKFHAWLTKEVRHQLVMLPWYSVFDNLEYKIEGAKVILSGQVVRPSLKDDSARAVKEIEGVEAVENNIEVLPVSPNDDRIRREEFRAIYSFPSLERYAMGAVPPIHIIVKNGNVTLEGVVAAQADKDAANVRANGVSGVFSVTNNLRVEESK
ncbi:MAG: BON domain-containing protein [Candidatus Acidiferrales bacterium]